MRYLERNAAPWVDRTIRKAWERIASVAPDGALPVPLPGKTTEFRDFGSGHYGCVMPTTEEGVVLKLTTDVSEANFVSLLVNDPEFRHFDLSGLVHYYDIIKLKGLTHKRRPIFAIWREEAYSVGFAAGYPGPRWQREMMRFKDLTHIVQVYLRPGKPGFEKRREKVLRLADWAARFRGEDMPSWVKNPEKSAIAIEQLHYFSIGLSNTQGIYHVGETLYELLSADVILADVHLNNIGKVRRDDYEMVVITDPGHMVLLNPEMTVPPIAEV